MTADKRNVGLDDLLTPDELCALFKVKKPWLYRAVREQRIPTLRIGKYLRFSRSQVEKWLAQSQGK